MTKVHEKGSDVGAEDGVVYVDGPGGVAVAMTPNAALTTSDELHEASVEAHGQNVQAGRTERTPSR